MRRRTWSTLGGLVLAGLLGWGLWTPTLPDPVVRGKRLSAWLDERRQPAPSGPITLSVEAGKVVRSLGPEAVPTLLAWLRLSDSAAVRYSQAAGQILHLPIGLPDHGDERTRAALGLQALGPAARSAWPAVVDLILHGEHEQAQAAMFVLYDAEAEAARLLVPAALSDPDPLVRARAIRALRIIPRAAAEVGLPTLKRLQADPDPLIVAEASAVLGNADAMLQWVRPNLKHPDADIRCRTAAILGGHGASAAKYLPDLEALAADPDPTVRAAVAEAIRRILSPAP